MAVGDDAQAIFGFRDTSPEFMINFEQYFGHFTDFALVENHRSTKNIVDFANAVNDKSDFKLNLSDSSFIITSEIQTPITYTDYTSTGQLEAQEQTFTNTGKNFFKKSLLNP